MSKTTEVLLYEATCSEDISERDFISAVHGKEPAFILVYRLPWKEYVDTATCLNCAAKSLRKPCKFGTLDLDNNSNIQERYSITQANRIMLFKSGRMYFLPMQDLSITAFDEFLTEGHKIAVSTSLPTKYTMKKICLNMCADLVGVWCDHVGTFIVVMAFIVIVVVALFIIMTSNKIVKVNIIPSNTEP